MTQPFVVEAEYVGEVATSPKEKLRSLKDLNQETWQRFNEHQRNWLKFQFNNPGSFWHRSHSPNFLTRSSALGLTSFLDVEHQLLLEYTTRIHEAVTRLPKTERVTRAQVTANIRNVADLASRAQEEGLGDVTYGFDGHTYSHSPLIVTSEIMAKGQAYWEKGIIDKNIFDAGTDTSLNNWDILYEQDSWNCLEALAYTLMHYRHTPITDNYDSLKKDPVDSLTKLHDPHEGVVTNFVANTARFVQEIAKQYPTIPTATQVQIRFMHDNQIVLNERTANKATVRFGQPPQIVEMSRLEAYSYLTALKLFQQSLS